MNAIIVWFVIGIACMAAELFTPSFIIVFFGVGAWAAALVAGIFPGLEQEVAAFLLVSLASLLILRRRMVETFRGRHSDAPSSGAADASPGFVYTGSPAEVTRAIPAGGTGEVELGGSFWRATCEEAVPAGARVRVKGPSVSDVLLLEVEVPHGGLSAAQAHPSL